MNDFEHRLTALLDDVAASVHPHPRPDSMFIPIVTPVTNHASRYRPRFAVAAAAGVLVLGGSALAMERVTSEPPNRVTTADTPVTEPSDEAITTTAPPVTEPAIEPITTLEDSIDITPTKPLLGPVVGGNAAGLAFEPKADSTLPPVAIEFTANLGADGRAKNPMQQGFYGTALPGSAIRVASSYGVAETTAGAGGEWETTLKMIEVPYGTKVGVRITSSTSDKVREFALLRPAPLTPATIEFTANLGADGQANTPMTQGFFGTAQPGSAIRIASDWGVAETVAGLNGNWDATLVMYEVQPGTKVGVRITSSTADKAREFMLRRPGAPTPPSIAFTASAAFTTCDSTPPFNEYWGTSTAGAVISITSPYGSGQVESNAEGHWEARLEFPEAPIGVAFNVHITSSKGEAVYDFPLTRVGPA